MYKLSQSVEYRTLKLTFCWVIERESWPTLRNTDFHKTQHLSLHYISKVWSKLIRNQY